jgi:hypothetical protein
LAEFRAPSLKRKGLFAGIGQSLVRRTGWWVFAMAALVMLIAAPVYQNMRAARQEREDALLLEAVQARVSRAVPTAMEPLVQPQLGEAR